ncbi:DUF1285 domain-containing protein [Oceaniserpentilla sp. 4NH20-0058]|uniref:DUF1285 domain-containing protein n=1 Tax=Oceaniserpentilla sp. 4NH20-0058 TaxID=3127660 RepID=UPI00310716D1
MDLTVLSQQLGRFLDMPSQLPPIDQWHPDFSGDIDIRIDKNGKWFHEGDPILREKLMRLFSTILKYEGGEYFLVTPVEKWRIQVEDQPFVAVLSNNITTEMGQNIELITNTGDELVISSAHNLEIDAHEAPKVHVRAGMFARLNRNVYYDLASSALAKDGRYMVESAGELHQIG